MWPNSKVTSIPPTDIHHFSKKKGYWKSLRNFIDFVSLEGERYDTLSSILKSEVCKIIIMHNNYNYNYYRRQPLAILSGFHLGFFVWGGRLCAKDQLCVKHAKFLSPFLSINRSPMHEKT